MRANFFFRVILFIIVSRERRLSLEYFNFIFSRPWSFSLSWGNTYLLFLWLKLFWNFLLTLNVLSKFILKLAQVFLLYIFHWSLLLVRILEGLFPYFLICIPALLFFSVRWKLSLNLVLLGRVQVSISFFFFFLLVLHLNFNLFRVSNISI